MIPPGAQNLSIAASVLRFSVSLITMAMAVCVFVSRRAVRRSKELTSELVQALQTSSQRMELLVDCVDQYAIYMLDLDGNVVTWNRGAQRIKGYEEGEIVGRHHSIFYSPEDRASGVPSQVLQAAYEAGRYSGEGFRVRKDGTPFRASFVLNLIRDSHGRPIGFAKVTRDLSESIRAESEKAELIERLIASNRALIQANEDHRQAESRAQEERIKAIEASKIKSDFLAMMSHEIRTPINGVLGMSGVLLDDALSPEHRSQVQAIRRSAESLLIIVNDILDFSKVEAGKLELESLEFDLGQLVRECVESLKVLADEKGIALSCGIDGEIKNLCVGDPGRIRQVLGNLINNSIKFTPRGAVNVTLAPMKEAKVTTFRFEIRDSGIGIPSAALDRLFSAFSQVDGSTTRRFGGTGLGLSICKRLVDLMGGTIGVESKEGEGSNFWFEIPLGQSRRDVSAIENTMTGPVPRLAGRILVVEDNPINQKVALLQLRKFGLNADAVGNGVEAIDSLRSLPYDLVLMDCQMPELDGFEATRIIRTSKTLPCSGIPIVAMTANAIAGDRERCLAAGMNDYVRKPVFEGELFKVLAKWLKSPTPTGAVDLEAIEQFRKIGAPELFAELRSKFALSVPAVIEELRSASRRDAWTEVGRKAHILISSAGNLGAMNASIVARKLEEACLGRESPEILRGIVSELERELVAAVEALNRVDEAA